MKETLTEWDKYSKFFGIYEHKMKSFYDTGGLVKIQQFLKAEKAKNKTIYPEGKNIFKCFQTNNIKVALIGLCPYHTIKNGIIANGNMLGTSNGILQPSLKNYYKAVSEEFEVDEKDMKMSSDTDWLAKQGVFLYNVALTVEALKPLSHQEIWKDFSKHVFENIIAPTNCPVIFLGKECHKFANYLLPFQWNFKLSHPASASYSGGEWSSEGVFKKVNSILMDNNGFEIDWCNLKEKQ